MDFSTTKFNQMFQNEKSFTACCQNKMCMQVNMIKILLSSKIYDLLPFSAIPIFSNKCPKRHLNWTTFKTKRQISFKVGLAKAEVIRIWNIILKRGGHRGQFRDTVAWSTPYP